MWSLGVVEHGADEVRGLDGTGADSFRSSFAEQTGHGGFVGQGELVLVLKEIRDYMCNFYDFLGEIH